MEQKKRQGPRGRKRDRLKEQFFKFPPSPIQQEKNEFVTIQLGEKREEREKEKNSQEIFLHLYF